MREAERRANEIVWENRPVAVRFEDANQAQDLRKPSEREGTLRIVSIQALDRSACGGTHVRATGEIGAILLRKTDKVRQTTRIEFLCGGRATARARADYDALLKAAQLFSAPLDEVPSLVAVQLEAARAAEKAGRKLELELAAYRAGNCIPPRKRLPRTAYGEFRGAPNGAAWRTCAPLRKASRRNPRRSSWRR